MLIISGVLITAELQRPSAPLQSANMLGFHESIVEEVAQQDGLVVMAAGLGMHKVGHYHLVTCICLG